MFSAKIKTDTRNKQVFIKINDLRSKNKEGIRKAFYDVGKDLTKTARALILEPKHGKIYKIKRLKRIKKHRASAPDEAPANQTGRLRKSMGFDVSGSNKLEFGARAGQSDIKTRKESGVLYGIYLEEGTKHMEPRPFVITTIKKEERNTRARFEAWIKKELNE